MSKKNTIYYFKDSGCPIYKIDNIDEELYAFHESKNESVIVIDQVKLDSLIDEERVVAEDDMDITPMEMLENILETMQEFPEPAISTPISIPTNYTPDLSNTTRTSSQLSKMLSIALKKEDKPDCISMLFHGTPGTGKTIAAAHLAKSLNMEIRSYNIAELQNKYIGESEKQIKKAFDDAEANNHILLIDELDSISGKREDANRDHEIKFTNCLLQCLDTFKGIFIATTNLLTHIDPAILRRFLLKQEFKNVTSEQAKELSRIYFSYLSPKNLPNEVLAPADFNIVKNSLIFEEEGSITQNYIKKRLLEEALLRNGKDLEIKKIPMGFHHLTESS